MYMIKEHYWFCTKKAQLRFPSEQRRHYNLNLFGVCILYLLSFVYQIHLDSLKKALIGTLVLLKIFSFEYATVSYFEKGLWSQIDLCAKSFLSWVLVMHEIESLEILSANSHVLFDNAYNLLSKSDDTIQLLLLFANFLSIEWLWYEIPSKFEEWVG